MARRWSIAPTERAIFLTIGLLLIGEGLFFSLTGSQIGVDAALDIATGTKSPFDHGGGWALVGLASFSWLLVPALVGAIVTLMLSRVIVRRLLSDNTVQEKAAQLLAQAASLRDAQSQRAEAASKQAARLATGPVGQPPRAGGEPGGSR